MDRLCVFCAYCVKPERKDELGVPTADFNCSYKAKQIKSPVTGVLVWQGLRRCSKERSGTNKTECGLAGKFFKPIPDEAA